MLLLLLLLGLSTLCMLIDPAEEGSFYIVFFIFSSPILYFRFRGEISIPAVVQLEHLLVSSSAPEQPTFTLLEKRFDSGVFCASAWCLFVCWRTLPWIRRHDAYFIVAAEALFDHRRYKRNIFNFAPSLLHKDFRSLFTANNHSPLVNRGRR